MSVQRQKTCHPRMGAEPTPETSCISNMPETMECPT